MAPVVGLIIVVLGASTCHAILGRQRPPLVSVDWAVRPVSLSPIWKPFSSEQLVYIPFIDGTLARLGLTHSTTGRPHLFHNRLCRPRSSVSDPGEAGFPGTPPLSPLSLASSSQSPARCPSRGPATRGHPSAEFSESPAFLVQVLIVSFRSSSQLKNGDSGNRPPGFMDESRTWTSTPPFRFPTSDTGMPMMALTPQSVYPAHSERSLSQSVCCGSRVGLFVS